MKKPFLLLSFLAALAVARAAMPQLTGDGPKHVEFKYYGFYCVVDYTQMIHGAANNNGAYMDVYGIMHSFPDKYSLSGVSAVVGWQWRKESALGIGFSYLSDPVGSFSQIPIFIEYRTHFLRNRVTPFTAVQFGYSIPFGTKNLTEEYTRIDEGGLTFGVSAGARLAVTQKFAFNIFVGYQFIHLNSVERGFNEVAVSRFPELYNNLKFGVGVNF